MLFSRVPLHALDFSTRSLYQIPVHVFIIILCFIMALASKLQKQQPRYLNSFILYILLTIILEVVAWWYSLHRRNNLAFYNFYAVINFTYLTCLLRSFIANEKVKKALLWVACIYPVLAIINILWIQGLHNFNTYVFLSGCLLIVTASICYFYERIKIPGPHSLLRDPTFWISTGLLFYYSCSLPLNGILNFISSMPLNIYKAPLYIINVVINIILYLLFSISFICNLIFRKSS